MKPTVAAFELNDHEAAVLTGALYYYTDTLFDPEEMDDDDREAQRVAERLRERIRKSIERHGYDAQPRQYVP